MKNYLLFTLLLTLQFLFITEGVKSQNGESQKKLPGYKIDLSGDWLFQVDSLDKGVKQQWFIKKLEEKIKLPGSMTTNGKGDDVTVTLPGPGR